MFFLVPSPSGRCPVETANLQLLLALPSRRQITDVQIDMRESTKCARTGRGAGYRVAVKTRGVTSMDSSSLWYAIADCCRQVFMPWHCVYFNCESKKDELVLSCKLNEGSIATHSNITRRIPELCSNRLI